MNHRRQLAATLACTLTVGLCAGHVLADGTPTPSELVPAPEIISPAPNSPETSGIPEPDPSVPESPSAGDTESTTESDPTGSGDVSIPDSNREPIIVDDQISPDAKIEDKAGTVSFKNLEARLRKNNLNILSLEENINAIRAVDLDEMEKGLKQAITMLIEQQRQLEQLVAGTNAAFNGLQGALTDMETGLDITGFQPAMLAYPMATIQSLEAQIQSYQSTLDQLEDGVIANEYAAASSQLETAQDQVVMGAETLYITLMGLEQTAQSLDRSLAALDRTLAELDVRYEMGQISSLTLAEAKSGRTTLASGIDTLNMNRTALKRQLEAMLGEEITGTIQLQPLHSVTQAQINAMDYEKDLKQAKRASYELQAASKAWDDADYKYASLRDSAATPDYEVIAARYNVKAAKLALQAARQNFELKFSSAYDTVFDQQQVLSAAKTALAVKEDSYAAAQLKYEQGTISKNELLDARDAMEEAQDTVDTASVDLFTAYNNYRWAVDHGILN